MEQLGIDFNATGSVMSKEQLEDQRRKRGECLTCGRKCFQKKLFKMIPITDHGKVLNGRCLNCKPLKADNKTTVLPAVSRPATQQDLEAFTRSQSSLRMMNGPGVRPMKSTGDSSRSAPPVSNGAPTQKPAPSAKKALDQRAMSYRMPPSAKPEVSARSVDTAPFPSTSAAAAASANNNDEDENSVISEEDEAANVHSALLGAMAAKRLANNFREKKAGQKTTGEEDEDTTLEASSYQNGLSSAQSTHSRCSHRSETATGDRSSQLEGSSDHSMEEDLVLPKKHGMLNRGGAITFDNSGHISYGEDVSREIGVTNGDKHHPPITSMVAESSRTISSMSSLGSGDFHSGGHQLSWKPSAIIASRGTPGAVYEDDEISEASSVGSPIQDASTARAHSPPQRSRPSSVASLKSASGRSVGSNRSSSRNVLVEQEEQRILGLIQANETEYSETIRYIKENPSSALILEAALGSISRLILTEDDYQTMPSLGVFDAIVTAMRCHPHASEVQMAGCGAMWNLSATAENQVALVNAGALDTIFTAMIGFPDDAAMQEKAMAALSNIAAAEANQGVLLEKDVLTKVVEAMNGHTDDTNVQVKGCAVITNMASYDTPAKVAIMESGAGGVVVVSMVMHPDNVELQERALRALRNICANSDLNKIAVANVGGIDSTVSAMQIHRDEAGVQEAGAWTLSNLSVNPDNRAVIGDSGGIDVIIRAMWVHIHSIGVQEWCCRALWSLTIDPHNRAIVLQVGGISAIVNTMQAHVDNPTIQEKCCGTLSNLASGSDEKVKMQIVDEEALDAIILAMVLHSDNQSVQDRACSVLRRIAVPSNVKQMQAANVSELVRIARDKFPDKCGDKANQILSVL